MTKYLVTVSTPTRHGRTKLHTFGKLIEAEHLDWFVETHASRKQLKQRRAPESPFGVASWPPPARRDLGTPTFDELGNGAVDLAEGVDIPKSTLTVVLDALRSDERHEVDLADLKCVISQLGSRIAKLDGLSDDDRRYAVPALYEQILSVLDGCREWAEAQPINALSGVVAGQVFVWVSHPSLRRQATA